jgi:crossover junction endodeoxyribonuclease RuvC
VSGRRPLRVLGVDPGTRVVGWGVVETDGMRLVPVAFGAIRAPDDPDVARRLVAIAEDLRRIVAEHEPDEAAIEEAFHGRDARAALKVGEGRGAALVVLASAGLPVAGYANNVVKRAVSGAGRAPKERVQAMVTRLLGLAAPPRPFDAADALAVAICHHQRRGDPRRLGGEGGFAPRVAAAVAAARAEDLRRRGPRVP